MKTVQIGSLVQVVDEVGVQHAGLVTAAWGSNPNEAQSYDDSEGKQVHLALNVVYVSADENKRDCYGRQIEHSSSMMHRSAAGGCPGRYWWQE